MARTYIIPVHHSIGEISEKARNVTFFPGFYTVFFREEYRRDLEIDIGFENLTMSDSFQNEKEIGTYLSCSWHSCTPAIVLSIHTAQYNNNSDDDVDSQSQTEGENFTIPF